MPKGIVRAAESCHGPGVDSQKSVDTPQSKINLTIEN